MALVKVFRRILMGRAEAYQTVLVLGGLWLPLVEACSPSAPGSRLSRLGDSWILGRREASLLPTQSQIYIKDAWVTLQIPFRVPFSFPV
ncbi:hypothetical protein MRX96_004881 [Rhipicephalus microplus]